MVVADGLMSRSSKRKSLKWIEDSVTMSALSLTFSIASVLPCTCRVRIDGRGRLYSGTRPRPSGTKSGPRMS
jgi:hypothetical protein